MQSNDAVSIRFADEFEGELYKLSKRFRNIRYIIADFYGGEG